MDLPQAVALRRLRILHQKEYAYTLMLLLGAHAETLATAAMTQRVIVSLPD